jgi:2-dehydro-3-deoxygluconokinase
MIDWDSMLDTRLVFITGITAALTEKTAATVTTLAQRAAAAGVDVALDVNYRGLLWSPEEAAAVLEPIARLARIIFCSRRDAETVFKIEGQGAEVSRKVKDKFGAEYVVSTDQIDGVYYSGPEGEMHFDVQVVPVVDRPGAGDAFVAGTIHGLLDGDVIAGIGYGKSVARHALTHHGDLTCVGARDIASSENTDIIR